jgi:positive regulator of sigma E activity
MRVSVLFLIINNALFGQLALLQAVPLFNCQQVSFGLFRKYQKSLEKQQSGTPAIEQKQGNVNPSSVGV